jgi:hypothetical protein
MGPWARLGLSVPFPAPEERAISLSLQMCPTKARSQSVFRTGTQPIHLFGRIRSDATGNLRLHRALLMRLEATGRKYRSYITFIRRTGPRRALMTGR